MAMKIRCTECGKRISIDEAFAGGVCRCPYCKELVSVPGGGDEAPVGARPEAPEAERPAAPEAAAPRSPEAAARQVHAEHAHVPMARPVKIQGVVTLILLPLLLVMIAAAVVVIVMYATSGDDLDSPVAPNGGPTDLAPVNPLVPGDSPSVGRVEIETPVVYVIDTSSSMQHMFDFAAGIVEASVVSLGNQGKFTVYLAAEGEDRVLPGGWASGGQPGRAAAREFLYDALPVGAADMSRTFSSAMALEPTPKTIVLFARQPDEGLVDLAAGAGEKGVTTVTVAMDAARYVEEDLAAVAEAGGGEALSYGFSQLTTFVNEAPLQP